MARRLARRSRQAEEKGVHHQERRAALPGQNAAGVSRKKIAGAGTLGHLARAWSATRPPTDIDARTASYIRAAWPKKTPDSITLSDIFDLIGAWEKSLSAATVFAYIKSLKRFLRFIDEDHGTRLAKLVPRQFKPQPRKLTCTDDEFGRILNHSPMWLRVFLQLCRTLGMRHSEALELTPNALNEDTNTLIFARKDQGTSDLPLTPELAAAIRLCKLQSPDRPIIAALGGPTTQDSVRQAWNRAKKKANARPELIIHDLRRTGATRVYAQTKDLRLAQQLLGHTHLASTLLYLAPNEKEELTAAIRAAAPVNLSNLKPATEVKQ